MKILTREEFLKLPVPALYTKLYDDKDPSDGLWIKFDNCGDNDWCKLEVTACNIELLDMDCEQDPWSEIVHGNYKGRLKWDHEGTMRDGCFEGDECRFVVYEKEDLDALIKILKLCSVMAGTIADREFTNAWAANAHYEDTSVFDRGVELRWEE